MREAERELLDAKARNTVELRVGGGRTAASGGATAVRAVLVTNSEAAGSL